MDDRALALNLPKSIATEFIKTRGIYISYPTGAQIQIYLLKLIFPKTETIIFFS
jgi:hypothetical protein